MLLTLIAAVLFYLPNGWTGDVCPPQSSLPSCTCRNMPLENGEVVTATPASSLLIGSNATTMLYDAGGMARVGDNFIDKSLYTIVDCKMFRTVTALYETISLALHRKAVDKLIVSNVPPIKEHTLARLPGRWLKNVRVKQFEIHDSLLSGDFIWYDNPFEGQANHLLYLVANRCSLGGALTYDDVGTTNTKGLEDLRKIEALNLAFNHLLAVKSTAFLNPPANLSGIVLSHNSLHSIENGAFHNVSLLKSVDLSHNLLEAVERGIFATIAEKLEEINLSWNFLETLPSDFFNGMPVLKTLKLSKNFLYTMPESPWLAVWQQLSFIDLKGNYIRCDCNLLWLVSPSLKTNDTFPALFPDANREIQGKCIFIKRPGFYAILYNLENLERNQLMC